MIRAEDDIFFTRTMAEIYEGQGHYDDALMIYRILADTFPDDLFVKEKIDGLKALSVRGFRPKKKANGVE